MTELEALIAINMAADIAGIRLMKLLAYFGAAQRIVQAPVEELQNVEGIGPVIAAKLAGFNPALIEQELSLAREYGLKVITYNDSRYPVNLRYIPDFPIVLYVKGSFCDNDRLAFGVVGSRRASFYGLENSSRFSCALAQQGFTIVSGLARGIDTCAHKGALQKGGRTIAVMGSGFATIYPRENRQLAERIASSGAVISEFPIKTGPFKQNFPRRNRVISGLSLGVLVVEASRNSGALITADFALEQGREVFALPGKVDSQNSLGTHRLIQQGAKLVSSVDDIMDEFDCALFRESKIPERFVEPAEGKLCDKDERLLFNILSSVPLHFDDIVEKTNLSIPALSAMIYTLQAKHLITQLPGKQFIRSDNETQRFGNSRIPH